MIRGLRHPPVYKWVRDDRYKCKPLAPVYVMKLTDATTTDELTHELTDDALDVGRPGLAYNPDRPYATPLSDPVYSHDHNWSNNWVPSNCIKYIRTAPTVAEGVADVAEMVVARFEEVSGFEMPAEGIVGVYRIVAGRWGIGAVGENFHETNLKADGAEMVEIEGVDDVKYKVDVESDRGKDQVKLADEKRSWKCAGKSTRVVWVKPTENGLTTEVVNEE